jgi:hypothetical protein
MTSFLYVASYCYLSVTLRTISSTVITLQDNRAVVRNFIALLSFSVDSPLYTPVKHCERTVSGSKNITFFFLITLNPFILRHTHRLILLIMTVYLYLTQCISVSHTLYIYISHSVYLYLTRCISVSHTLYIYISHSSGDTCHKTINCLRTPRSVAVLAVTYCITKVILILPLLW